MWIHARTRVWRSGDNCGSWFLSSIIYVMGIQLRSWTIQASLPLSYFVGPFFLKVISCFHWFCRWPWTSSSLDLLSVEVTDLQHLVFYVMLGTKPRTLYGLGKHVLYQQSYVPNSYFVFFEARLKNVAQPGLKLTIFLIRPHEELLDCGLPGPRSFLFKILD